MKQTTLDLIKNINENTFIPATTQNELFELFQLDTVADLRKVSRNFMKLYELLEHLDNQTSSATSEKKGIVKLGTEIGTSLEGNRLAEILGIEFGGNIQDTGNKVKGKFYFDSVTKFYYECIENTNLTYNESSKFRAISNKPLSDKVENLSKVQHTKLYVHSEATGQGRTTCNIVQKCGNIVTIIFDSGDTLRYTNDNTVIFSIPEGYRPKTFLSVNASQFNGTAGTIYIHPDGTAKWRGSTVTTASIIFSVSYII